jgi:hypothetical protein
VKKLQSISLPSIWRVILVSGFVLAPLTVVAQGYTEPSGVPPTGSNIEFLNASSQEQRLQGSLVLGERNGSRLPDCTDTNTSQCARLCLNSDPAKGFNDTTNCINNWSDLALRAGGPFLRLLPESSAIDPSIFDNGYVALQANVAKNQLNTLTAEATDASNGTSTAIRAESYSSSSWAGQFFGTLSIQHPAGTAQLCLNGACISDWSQAVPKPADTLLLQSTRYLTAQSGHVGLSGPFQANSLIVGDPTASTPAAYTCGDGLCSIQNETVTNCPADCQ